MSTNSDFFFFFLKCGMLHQTTVTLRSPFGPLFLMCRAGGLGLGGPWLLAHPPFTPVLKSLLLPGPNSGKTSMLSEQPEGDSLSLTLTFPGRVERAVEPGILWEEGFEWNQSPPHSLPHPSSPPPRGRNITCLSSTYLLIGGGRNQASLGF